MQWVIVNSPTEGSTYWVHLMMANHANADGHGIYPGERVIGRECRLSERTVRTAIRELEQLGLLVEEEWPEQERLRRSVRRGRPPKRWQLVMDLAASSAGISEGITGKPVPNNRQAAQALPIRNRPEPSKRKELASGKEAARGDVDALCSAMADLLDQLGVKHSPPTSDSWRRPMRLLLDADKRPRAQVAAVMRWALADGFWRANVHSPKALHARFDQLRLQMQQPVDRRRGFEHPLDRMAREHVAREGDA